MKRLRAILRCLNDQAAEELADMIGLLLLLPPGLRRDLMEVVRKSLPGQTPDPADLHNLRAPGRKTPSRWRPPESLPVLRLHQPRCIATNRPDAYLSGEK